MIIPRYSRPKLEVIAQKFLSEKGVYDNRALRIELVIQKLGWELVPIPNLAEIAVAYIPVEGKRIYVDEEEYSRCESYSWRFTLAEELAHILLHHKWFTEGHSVEQIEARQRAISDSQYERLEGDAKYLAGALLMPKVPFIERFTGFWGQNAANCGNDIETLRRVLRSLNFDFNVSHSIAANRALVLNLIDEVQHKEWAERNELRRSRSNEGFC